jgi:hypothetical protein
MIVATSGDHREASEVAESREDDGHHLRGGRGLQNDPSFVGQLLQALVACRFEQSQAASAAISLS